MRRVVDILERSHETEVNALEERIRELESTQSELMREMGESRDYFYVQMVTARDRIDETSREHERRIEQLVDERHQFERHIAATNAASQSSQQQLNQLTNTVDRVKKDRDQFRDRSLLAEKNMERCIADHAAHIHLIQNLSDVATRKLEQALRVATTDASVSQSQMQAENKCMAISLDDAQRKLNNFEIKIQEAVRQAHDTTDSFRSQLARSIEDNRIMRVTALEKERQREKEVNATMAALKDEIQAMKVHEAAATSLQHALTMSERNRQGSAARHAHESKNWTASAATLKDEIVRLRHHASQRDSSAISELRNQLQTIEMKRAMESKRYDENQANLVAELSTMKVNATSARTERNRSHERHLHETAASEAMVVRMRDDVARAARVTNAVHEQNVEINDLKKKLRVAEARRAESTSRHETLQGHTMAANLAIRTHLATVLARRTVLSNRRRKSPSKLPRKTGVKKRAKKAGSVPIVMPRRVVRDADTPTRATMVHSKTTVRESVRKPQGQKPYDVCTPLRRTMASSNSPTGRFAMMLPRLTTPATLVMAAGAADRSIRRRTRRFADTIRATRTRGADVVDADGDYVMDEAPIPEVHALITPCVQPQSSPQPRDPRATGVDGQTSEAGGRALQRRFSSDSVSPPPSSSSSSSSESSSDTDSDSTASQSTTSSDSSTSRLDSLELNGEEAIAPAQHKRHRKMLALCRAATSPESLIATIEGARKSKKWKYSTTATYIGALYGAVKNPFVNPSDSIVSFVTSAKFSKYHAVIRRKLLTEEVNFPKAANAQQINSVVSNERHAASTRMAILLAWSLAGRVSDILKIRTHLVNIKRSSQADLATVLVKFVDGKGVNARKQPFTVATTVPRTLATTLHRFVAERLLKGNKFLWSEKDRNREMRAMRAVLKPRALELRSMRRGALQTMALAKAEPTTLRYFSHHSTDAMLDRYLGWGWFNVHKHSQTIESSAALWPASTGKKLLV